MPDTIERDGVRYVLVPEDEYRRFREAEEDREDVDLFDEARRNPSEFLPFEMTERMIAGESPVRVYREHRGMTQSQLAAAVGISKPFLSQIEAGERRPSLDTVRRLAETLQVTVDDLI